MGDLLYQVMIYLGAAVLAVPLAARLGFGSVLGYLVAGIIIGPVLHLVGHETHDLQHFAEFGVVMMLFLIGLELEPRVLWNMRGKLLGLGGMQILLTIILIFGIALLLNQTWRNALAIGMILSLSSTAIVLQTLTEKGLVRSAGGRNVFAVLLAQDIAVIPMLVVMPILGTTTLAMLNPDGSISITNDSANQDASTLAQLLDSLPTWALPIVTALAIAAIILAGIFLTRPIFKYIDQANLPEMHTALALFVVVSTAVLMHAVNLSPALGAFLAGVVLANSEFKHQFEVNLEPFKGLLLGLFFITVGAGFDLQFFQADAPRLIALTVLLIAVKSAVLWFLARSWGLPPSQRRLFTLALGQSGEFGFVLISFALSTGGLTPNLGRELITIIALSMLFTPLLFLLYEWLDKRAAKSREQQSADEILHSAPTIIAGTGRFGQIVNSLVRSAGFETVMVDNDLSTVQLMRRFGFRAYFGNPTRADLLRAAGIEEAEILVVAIDDQNDAVKIVKYVRGIRPDIHIVARARDRVNAYELFAAGADDIVREMFDSSLRAGRYVLENLGLSEYEAAEAEDLFYHHDRSTLKDLAELWKPGVKIVDNPEYIERAKDLNNDFETALATLKQTTGDAQDPARTRVPGRGRNANRGASRG